MTPRLCKYCGEWKPLSAFDTTRGSYLRRQCRACRWKKGKIARDNRKPPKKKNKGDISWLAGHVNPPTVQDPVLVHICAMGSSFTLRDIADALDLTAQQANRVLGRLAKKGVVARHRIPDGARMVYLYRLVEGA